MFALSWLKHLNVYVRKSIPVCVTRVQKIMRSVSLILVDIWASYHCFNYLSLLFQLETNNAPIFFSDWKTGRCSSTVQVRLLCFWDARNVRRGEKLWESICSRLQSNIFLIIYTDGPSC